MEEDNGQNSNELHDDVYRNEVAEKAKDIGKQVTKKATNEVKREAKQAVKKALKELLKKLISMIPPQVWLIIAAVVLGIILLAGFWYAIKNGSYNSISEIAHSTTSDDSGNIKTITSIDEENRQLVIDSEALLKQVDEWFDENYVSPETLGLKNGDYSTLVTFLEAETVSSFPDLRTRDKIGTPVKQDELQGIVQFKRKYEDGTEQLLEYKNYTDFRKEVAKLGEKLDDEETQEQIYFTKDEVENAYNQLKTYFTLDKDFNAIIVSISTDENKVTYSDYAKEEGNEDSYSYNYNITVNRINYQSVIQIYSMPFEFPLALLMVTNNPEFCEEVAKLAMPTYEGDDSTANNFSPKIIIDIQDNTSSSYNEDNYGYTANFKLQDSINYNLIITDSLSGITTTQSGSQSKGEEKVVNADNYRIEQNWSKTVTPNLCVTEAITWIADYTSVYEKTDQTNPNSTNSSESDDENYVEVQDYHGYLANQNFDFNLPSNAHPAEGVTVDSNITSEVKKILEKKTNKNSSSSSSITTNQYNKISSIVEEKWERFLSLLKVESETGIYNLDNINKNDKYIKYNSLDSDYKVSPEENLLSAEAFLYELLESNPKTVEKEEIAENLLDIYTGRIKASNASFDFSVFEPGDFFSLNGGNIAYSSIEITDADFEILCKITSAERGGGTQEQQEYVVSVILNRVLSSRFPNSVRDVVFAPGQFEPISNGAYNRANPSETTKAAVRNVLETGDKTGCAVYFCNPSVVTPNSFWTRLIFLFNDNNNAALSHNFYTTEADRQELEQYATLGGGTIVQEAQEAHRYLETNGYSYEQKGLTIPDGILSGRKIDCSSFVSWVLYRAGYTQFAGYQKTSRVFFSNPWGWESFNSISNAKAGDILVYNGHVEIYAGQMSGDRPLVYNCGGNSSIRNAAPSRSGHTSLQIKKILRPAQ